MPIMDDMGGYLSGFIIFAVISYFMFRQPQYVEYDEPTAAMLNNPPPRSPGNWNARATKDDSDLSHLPRTRLFGNDYGGGSVALSENDKMTFTNILVEYKILNNASEMNDNDTLCKVAKKLKSSPNLKLSMEDFKTVFKMYEKINSQISTDITNNYLGGKTKKQTKFKRLKMKPHKRTRRGK